MRVSGQAVRAAREAMLDESGRSLSQEKLAARVGVSSGTIQRVELGKGDVAAGTAYLIAVELNVELETLFTDGAAA